MAQTLDGSIFPQAVRFTLGGSNVQTQVNIPTAATSLSVRSFTNDLKVEFSGSDGGTAGSNFITVDADSWAEMSLMDGIRESKGVTAVYISSATGSTVVECMIEG